MLKKRAWILILMSIVITFLITIQAVTHVQDERSRADVNQDGIINILDLVIVAKYLGEREEELDAEHALPEPATETESPTTEITIYIDDVPNQLEVWATAEAAINSKQYADLVEWAAGYNERNCGKLAKEGLNIPVEYQEEFFDIFPFSTEKEAVAFAKAARGHSDYYLRAPSGKSEKDLPDSPDADFVEDREPPFDFYQVVLLPRCW